LVQWTRIARYPSLRGEPARFALSRAQQTDQSGRSLIVSIVSNPKRLARDRWRDGTIQPAPPLAKADTVRVASGLVGGQLFASPQPSFVCLDQLEALAHLRHDIPPAAITQTATSNTLDARIPIATCCVWILSPQHNLKVFRARMLGKFFFRPRSSVSISIATRAMNVSG
jgi:hypothetical protein